MAEAKETYQEIIEDLPEFEKGDRFQMNSMSGKQKFTQKDIESMKQTAALRAADRNPYSWNMDFLPYADDSGYEARLTKCGICTLMQELELFDLVPASALWITP